MMKLSEAIREGAKLRPQGRLTYFSRDADTCLSCALGAAYEAITHEITILIVPENDIDSVIITLQNETGVNMDDRVSFPDLSASNGIGFEASVYNAISWLNDDYHWTREAIADWLESIGK